MNGKTVKDYYAILDVASNATLEEIRLAYRKMARIYHPDLSAEIDAEERFREVNQAYEVLASAEKRKAYDFFTASTISADEDGQNPDPATVSPVNTSPSAGPPQPSVKQVPANNKKRLSPPTWAILLMLVGGCIIVSVGIGALLSLQANTSQGWGGICQCE